MEPSLISADVGSAVLGFDGSSLLLQKSKQAAGEQTFSAEAREIVESL